MKPRKGLFIALMSVFVGVGGGDAGDVLYDGSTARAFGAAAAVAIVAGGNGAGAGWGGIVDSVVAGDVAAGVMTSKSATRPGAVGSPIAPR